MSICHWTVDAGEALGEKSDLGWVRGCNRSVAGLSPVLISMASKQSGGKCLCSLEASNGIELGCYLRRNVHANSVPFF